jgi:hypothetical protein
MPFSIPERERYTRKRKVFISLWLASTHGVEKWQQQQQRQDGRKMKIVEHGTRMLFQPGIFQALYFARVQ